MHQHTPHFAQAIRRPPPPASGRGGAAVLGDLAFLLIVCLMLGVGCARSAPQQVQRSASTNLYPKIDVEVFRRAETERAARLAQQVERLRGDLQQAEEALVMAESGLLGTHSRADAVSSLAEARIQVERAGGAAPWRSAEHREAKSKLELAAYQIEAGHFGAALFFVYRAERIVDTLEAEARQVYGTPGARFIRGARVNLRAGPSTSEPVLAVLSDGTPVFPETRQQRWMLVRTSGGAVGWVHESLITTQASSMGSSGSAATTQSRPAALAR